MDLEETVATLLKAGPKTNQDLRKELGLSVERYDQRLDRALQKMRKAGKLKLLKGRWVVASIEMCGTCDGKGWVHA